MKKNWFIRAVEKNIERYGRHLLGVFPDEDSDDFFNDSFTYTIGNTQRGLPELLIIGDQSADYLNILSEKMIERGAPFRDGEQVDIGGRYPVRVYCVTDMERLAERMVQADHYYSGRYDAMQVVMPDTQGRFPGEPGCAAPYAKAELYFSASRNKRSLQ